VLENDAGQSCHPARVINRPIRKFFSGIDSKLLYEMVLKCLEIHLYVIKLPQTPPGLAGTVPAGGLAWTQ